MSVTEPTAPEVEQSEQPNIPSVPVMVEGPIRVQELPATTGRAFSLTGVTTTEPKKLLDEDPRRKRAVIVGNDDDIFIGRTQQECIQGAILPVDTPVYITHKDPVWVAAVNSTTRVSCIMELWAD
jgi:hypothetical protein